MPLELQILGLAALLAVVQLVLFAVPANLQLGVAYTVGPRDEGRRLTGLAGRLERAFRNHMEGLVLFTVAAVLVTLAEASSPVTRAASIAYLAARVAYVPAYALGVPYLRSLIWAVGFLATLVVILVCLA